MVFVRRMPHGRRGSMNVVDFSFLRTGGVLLRGVLSWECPVGIMISMDVADFQVFRHGTVGLDRCAILALYRLDLL